MYGGTCINIGCVPTKAMLVDSDNGVGYEDSVTHRDGFIAQLNSANKQLADAAGVIVIDGHAAFTDAHSIVVTGGDEELSITADTIIIEQLHGHVLVSGVLLRPGHPACYLKTYDSSENLSMI